MANKIAFELSFKDSVSFLHFGVQKVSFLLKFFAVF